MIVLWDPSGAEIAFDDDSGACLFCSRLDFTLVGSGLFEVSVSGFFSSDTFNYRLDISGLTPVSAVPGPGTLALLGLGFAGFAATRRRKQ